MGPLIRWCALLTGSEQSHRSWKRNRGGVEPSGIVELTRAAQSVNPTAVVWKSDPRLPLREVYGSWGAPLDPRSMWRRVWMPSRKNSGRCFSESLSSLIFRRHGCCCSFVEPPGPISGCATFNLHRLSGMPSNTTTCGIASPDSLDSRTKVAGGQVDFVRSTWQRRTRSVECSSHQRSCPLGKLGGQFAHGASETPRKRKDDGRWVGTGAAISQLIEGVCSFWLTWVSSHRSESPCSSMPDLNSV